MFPLHDLTRSRTTALVTIALIALNVLSFAAWQPHDPEADVEFMYRRAAVACEITSGDPVSVAELEGGECLEPAAGAPIFPEKQIGTSVLVSMFLHGGLLHLAGNMWFLWIFGDNVEEAFGHLGYLLLYSFAGVAATLSFVLLHPTSVDPLVGASGAIAGVLGAYFVLFPKHLVLSLWPLGLIPVPAVIFLGLWFIGQFGVADAGVAWEAHVGGFVVGAAVAFALRDPLLARVRARREPARRMPW